MNTFRIVPIATLLALGVAGCGPQKEKEPAKPKVSSATEVAKPVMALPVLGPGPTWLLKDLNGKVVNSEELRGKVVVVDFWATWCGPCGMEIPGYIALQNKYGKDGLAIVGVSLDEAGVDVVRAFAGKNHMNYQVVMGDDKVQEAFGGLEAIPTTFIIDRSGQIRDKKIGVEETADYEKKILAVLREPPASEVAKKKSNSSNDTRG